MNNLKNKLSEFVGLSYLDFEGFIEKNFTWKIGWHEKIDCFKINITNYKIFVTDAFEKIFDTLWATLKEHLAKIMRNIHEFVKESMEKMNKKASNTRNIRIYKKFRWMKEK